MTLANIDAFVGPFGETSPCHFNVWHISNIVYSHKNDGTFVIWSCNIKPHATLMLIYATLFVKRQQT